VGLVLEDATVAERVEAVRELLLTLDSEDDIASTAVFEEGRVLVISRTGADEIEWFVPFHLVWPEPRLNNQHLNAVKLVNWTASGKAIEPTARSARQQATERLRIAIRVRIEAGGLLEGRIRIAE
jgi:hypothetical protein